MSIVPYKRTPRNTVSARSGYDDFDRIFDNLFKNALTNMAVTSPSVTDLSLKLDISETEKAYYVHAELPGVEEKNVDIEVNDGVLTVSGEKQSQSEEEGKTFHRVERSYGSFKRAMQLPADADEDKIKARMKNGVLEIEIEKQKEAQKKTRKIEVKS